MPLGASDTDIKIAIGLWSYAGDIEYERKALHEDIEIKCFYEGAAVLFIGTETVTVKAGDIVVINPYEMHATIDCGDSGSRYHRFMVPLDFFLDKGVGELDLRTILLANQKRFITKFSGNTRMRRMLMRAAAEYDEQSTAWHIAVQGLMTEFFALLLREGIDDKETAVSSRDALRSYTVIEPALRLIRDSYTESLTVDTLATLCGVSKHYFCRVFKNTTGKTAMEYLRDYRIGVSKALLRNTDKSVTEIADACGFESANYFCRVYKRLVGRSPIEYRREMRVRGVI